jgi:Protein of unknown function (DUF2887)
LYRANLSSDQVHRVYLEDFRNTSTESVGIGLMQLIVSDTIDAISKAKELLTQTQPLSKTDAKFSAIIELIVRFVWSKWLKPSPRDNFRPGTTSKGQPLTTLFPMGVKVPSSRCRSDSISPTVATSHQSVKRG